MCHGVVQIYKLNDNLRSTKITCNHIKYYLDEQFTTNFDNYNSAVLWFEFTIQNKKYTISQQTLMHLMASKFTRGARA